jgi:hypothetical protein
MNTELGDICRTLVEIANAAPAGPVRARMLGDLANLRRRLETMPDRVAEQVAMKPREAVQQVLDREIRFAFADVLKWFGEPVGRA